MGRRRNHEANVLEQLLMALLAAGASACTPAVDDTSAEVVPSNADGSAVGADGNAQNGSDKDDDSSTDDGPGGGYTPPPDDDDGDSDGASNPMPSHPDAGASLDAGSGADDGDGDDGAPDDGWIPVNDGDGSGGDGNDNGGQDGATPNDAGTVIETDAGDCRVLPHNTDSGPFGTREAVCFVVEQQPLHAWAAYNIDGRTITVNGVAVSVGQLPFPGTAPFVVVFSAGTYDYASWSYW
jgi:hypothetical protein